MKLPTAKLKRPESPFLTKWKALPEPKDGLVMRNLRGNPKSDVLFICEPCTEMEYENQVPFIDQGGVLFQSIFQSAARLNIDDFFVVPCAYFGILGKKPNKASTAPVEEFVREVANEPQFKIILCAGMVSFGSIFSGGRKTHADSIIGNPMWLPAYGNLPVWVMPDTKTMFPENPENYRDVNFAKEKREVFQNLTLNFAHFYESLKQ